MLRTLQAAAVALGLATVAAEAHAQYGAIAIDDATLNSGFRVGSATAADAQEGALYWCRNAGGTNCHLLWTFDHACGTYSVSQNHRYSWQVRNSGDKAAQVSASESASVGACRDSGGERCAPQVSMCSDDTSAYQFPGQSQVSAAVVAFAEQHTGQQVGDGQCWALVDAALAAAGAVRPGGLNFDTYVFGQETYGDFRPGDVIQFENVVLQSGGYTGNFPHHTAIVAAANGTVLTIYEQNANGVELVSSETIDISAKTSGLIRVYRPIPAR